jgi:hypothetical protein
MLEKILRAGQGRTLCWCRSLALGSGLHGLL